MNRLSIICFEGYSTQLPHNILCIILSRIYLSRNEIGDSDKNPLFESKTIGGFVLFTNNNIISVVLLPNLLFMSLLFPTQLSAINRSL